MFEPLLLSGKLAIVTTILLFIVGVPLAYYLTFSRSTVTAILDVCVSMPLVLPPSVMGFYLLLLMSPSSPSGMFFKNICHIDLVFSFAGLVVAAFVYSLPFMVNALKTGFALIPREIIEASYTLGKGKVHTVWAVILPNAKTAVMTGIMLTFAHTVGAFGIMLMVGGNIPGKTRVASIAIYNAVESLKYTQAHIYSAVLVAIMFIALLLLRKIENREKVSEA